MRTLKIDSLLDSRVYVDRDVIMLHACFQILQDCIEKENVDTYCNYDDHKEFVDEVRFLYNWWLKRKDDIDFDNDAQDDEMLIRLMKIRSSLWT